MEVRVVEAQVRLRQGHQPRSADAPLRHSVENGQSAAGIQPYRVTGAGGRIHAPAHAARPVTQTGKPHVGVECVVGPAAVAGAGLAQTGSVVGVHAARHAPAGRVPHRRNGPTGRQIAEILGQVLRQHGHRYRNRQRGIRNARRRHDDVAGIRAHRQSRGADRDAGAARSASRRGRRRQPRGVARQGPVERAVAAVGDRNRLCGWRGLAQRRREIQTRRSHHDHRRRRRHRETHVQ